MQWEFTTSFDPPFVRFGNGLLIRPRKPSGWEVCARDQSWPLEDSTQYWRTVALLEKPLANAIAAFDGVGKEVFPFHEVARAGLSMSLNWAKMALCWIADFTEEQRSVLASDLQKAGNGEWFDQTFRHNVQRLMKQR